MSFSEILVVLLIAFVFLKRDDFVSIAKCVKSIRVLLDDSLKSLMHAFIHEKDESSESKITKKRFIVGCNMKEEREYSDYDVFGSYGCEVVNKTNNEVELSQEKFNITYEGMREFWFNNLFFFPREIFRRNFMYPEDHSIGNNDIEKINFYITQISKADAKYEGDYSLNSVRSFYFDIVEENFFQSKLSVGPTFTSQVAGIGGAQVNALGTHVDLCGVSHDIIGRKGVFYSQSSVEVDVETNGVVDVIKNAIHTDGSDKVSDHNGETDDTSDSLVIYDSAIYESAFEMNDSVDMDVSVDVDFTIGEEKSRKTKENDKIN